MEKKARITLLFEQYTKDTITDDQISRITAPVIAEIRDKEKKRLAAVRRNRTYKRMALALTGTFVVSLAIFFVIIDAVQGDGRYAVSSAGSLLNSVQTNGQQNVPKDQWSAGGEPQTIQAPEIPLAAPETDSEGEGGKEAEADGKEGNVLSGRVSIGGSGVQGAEMRLLDADTLELAQTEQTDANGEYTFKGFQDGRYRLEIKLPEALGGSVSLQPKVYEYGDISAKSDEVEDKSDNVDGQEGTAEAGEDVTEVEKLGGKETLSAP